MVFGLLEPLGAYPNLGQKKNLERSLGKVCIAKLNIWVKKFDPYEFLFVCMHDGGHLPSKGLFLQRLIQPDWAVQCSDWRCNVALTQSYWGLSELWWNCHVVLDIKLVYTKHMHHPFGLFFSSLKRISPGGYRLENL